MTEDRPEFMTEKNGDNDILDLSFTNRGKLLIRSKVEEPLDQKVFP